MNPGTQALPTNRLTLALDPLGPGLIQEQVNTSSVFTGLIQYSSVQSLSRVRLFAPPRIAARQASLCSQESWDLVPSISRPGIAL